MMMHPWPADRLTGSCLAVSHFDVHFAGREAHASAAPWAGVNALDAMTIAQVALGLLRQQLPPGDQFHGVITQGGQAANVIPAAVTGRFMVRSRTIGGLNVLQPRVKACFEAGALATGSALTYEELSPVYSHMEADEGLLALYRRNAEALGRHFEADDASTPRPTFSTDMANVSLAVPTIHPLVGIETGGAVNHQHAFTAACITESADAAVRDGALALAWTAIDAATDPGVRQRLLGTPA
jgi:metal-dependent amidase/aminoacylase/carboxypeptidase family protein